ncbi:MAG: DUF1549 domain-containing protein [Planctomycetia bacterium]|nr:DUF1549 domain-containing protein [Planctomycetia bacterium]
MSRLFTATLWLLAVTSSLMVTEVILAVDSVTPPASQRFASKEADETPNFQQHVVPLLSRLGCNGRACHGSFQGQGGFRLSLFGYDFKLDHEALAKGDKEKDKEPRVLVDEVEDSLALLKATQEMPHRGGKRMDIDSWQYNIFRNWIKAGAKSVDADSPKFVKLEVTPSEIQFVKDGDETQITAVAVWSDGKREDVTPLCRFNSNDDLIAAIDSNGLVKSGQSGDTHIVVNYDAGVVPIPIIRPVSDKTGDNYPQIETTTKIDELIVQKLCKLGIEPSPLCDDHEFLRRASLDLAGTLPSPQEVVGFLADTDSNKRAKKIDELLERPGYAAWWSTKLCDYTGNNPTNLNNVAGNLSGNLTQEWYDWVYKRVAENTAYDKLVEGIVTAVSRNADESYTDYCKRVSAMYGPEKKGSFAECDGLTYYWGRRNFNTPDERAIGFAYTFMGTRIQCAQCHKHPFDQWTQDDFKEFTNFFKGTRFGVRKEDQDDQQALLKGLGLDPKQKKNGNDLRKELQNHVKKGDVVPVEELFALKAQSASANAKEKKPQKENPKKPGREAAGPTAKLLGSDVVHLLKHDDPRTPLMAWLRDAKNPYFAKAFVNRVWSNYFNVGIVQPVDDMSLANAPSNAPLLDYLAEGFIEHNFDMKWLHREICNSAAYQRSWKPNETNKLDQKNFSHAIPRRLPAEIALDALKQATLSDTEASTWLASNKGHMTSIPGSVSQRGGKGGSDFALTVFGRSTRESNCDCDRSMEASLLQTVYMQNDDQVFGMLNDNKGWIRSLTLTSTKKAAKNDPARSDPGVAKTKAVRRNFERLVANAERELKRARKAANEKEIKDLEQRIAELKGKLQKNSENDALESQPQEAAPTEVVGLAPDEIIKAAYLRSLSRLPNNEELETSKKFLTQSEDQVNGARDLLWALINTKEFIVNH